MTEAVLTLKFKGIEGEILNNMVESGLFATKSEAIRSALVKYAIDVNLFERKRLWDKISKHSRRKASLKQVLRDIKAVKNEARSIY